MVTRARPSRTALVLSLGTIAATASFSSSLGLRADVVHLKSGRTVEGTTSPGKKPGTTEVRTGGGTFLVIPDSDIARIEKKRSPAEEFGMRLKALPPKDIDALHDLLSYARDKGLNKEMKLVSKRILEIDPHDEAARKELGYVVFENRWVLEADLKKRKDIVRFRDEWMTVEEKSRRLAEEAQKEIEDLLGMADSDNPYVQEFSIRKVLSRREPAARAVFEKHLRDRRKIPRMIAIRGLGNFPVSEPADAASRRVAADLHRLALEEEDTEVLKVLYPSLGKFFPAESFRLALQTVVRSGSPKERERAAEILFHTLRKAYVPELCRAVVSMEDGKGRAEVRGVLERALRVNCGYDPAAWLRYWDQNRDKFTDE